MSKSLLKAFDKINRKEALPWDMYCETMAYTDFNIGDHLTPAVKTYFYRTPPFGGAYALFGGLTEFLHAVSNFTYTEAARIMRYRNMYSADFIEFLENRGKMNVKIHAVQEGSAIFPHEPVLIIEGDLIDIRFIEGFMHILNRGSLFLTKWRRVVDVCSPRPVFEFARRRAQAPTHASLYSQMAGAAGTSNANLFEYIDVNLVGTMGHEFVQSFENEFDAFDTFLQHNPSRPVLLIDTTDPLKKGMPAAIAAFKKHEARIKEVGAWDKCAVRNDSGDLVYLTVEEIKMLDAAGLYNVGVVQTNDLDEYVISSMKSQLMESFPVEEAARMLSRISYACGTRPGVCYDTPAFGGVAKLAMLGDNPVMKLTLGNPEKASIPGNTRSALITNEVGEIMCCMVYLLDEMFEPQHIVVYDKDDSTKYLRVDRNRCGIELRQHLVYDSDQGFVLDKTIADVLTEVEESVKQVGWYSRRLQNPNIIKVSLSEKLFNLRAVMKDKKATQGKLEWQHNSMV